MSIIFFNLVNIFFHSVRAPTLNQKNAKPTVYTKLRDGGLTCKVKIKLVHK